MRICKKILFILIVFSFCIKDVLAYGSKVSLYNFNRLYNLAARGNVTELINIKNSGYNIDAMNYYNDTGLCVAAKKGDVRAFNAFRMAGADIYHRCTRNISNYENFLVNGQRYNARPTYNAATYTQTGAYPTYYENGSAYNTANTTYGNSGYRYEGQPAGVEKVSGEEKDSSWLWWAAGGAAVIGGVAAAAGGGGGGGSDPCSGVVCGDNQHCQGGSCVCNEGYIDTEGEGVCYPVLECENGVQKGESCECNEGYELNGDKCVEYDCTRDGYVSGLTSCPTNATGCDTCFSGSNTYYKAKGCNEGYELNADTCETAKCEGYNLTDIPSNATYSYCKSGTTTKYKIESCNTGYELNGDTCEPAKCEGYNLTEIPSNATYSDCLSGTTTKYKIESCNEGYELNGDSCEIATCNTGCALNAASCGNGTGKTNGWELGTNCNLSGGNQCKTCMAKSCPTGTNTTWSTDAKCVSAKDNEIGWTSMATMSYNGDNMCYECTCSAPTECNWTDENKGTATIADECCNGKYKTCISTCVEVTVPENATGTSECTGCGVTVYTAWGCNEGYEKSADGKSCIVSQCNTGCATSVANCGDGTGQGNGWELGENCNTSGGNQCKKCMEKSCPTDTNTEWDTDAKCVSAKDNEIGWTSMATMSYNGDNMCYECTCSAPTECNWTDENKGTATIADECCNGKYKTCTSTCVEVTVPENATGTSECTGCGVKVYTAYKCNTGYAGDNCDKCAEGYGRDSTGKCVAKGEDIVATYSNYLSQSKTLVNDDYADLYGVAYDVNEGSVVGGDDSIVYLNYNEQDIKLTLENNGDGDVIGVSANTNRITTIAGSYLTRNDDGFNQQETLLKIENNGDGNVYGIKGDDTYSQHIFTAIFDYYSLQDETVDTQINITNNGTGNTYGIYNAHGGVSNGVYDAANLHTALEGNGSVGITVNSKGDAWGIYGAGPIENSGTIDVTSNGDVYGIQRVSRLEQSSNVVNKGTIYATANTSATNLLNASSAYGICADPDTSGTITNEGTINVKTQVTGLVGASSTSRAIGIKGHWIINEGDINVIGESGGSAYGIFGEYPAQNFTKKITNTGSITVSLRKVFSTASVSAYGIYSKGIDVENSGTITVNTQTEAKVYGIYAEGGTVTNTGTIKLNSGTPCSGSGCFNNGNHIVLVSGASLTNMGVMSTDGEFNFDAMGGEVTLGKGGSYEASSLKGKLYADSSIVSEGFKDEYKEAGALKSENTEVEIESKSAMFEAKIEEGEGVSSVVMNRKNFEELSQDNSIGKYLEENYKKGNNSLLYSELKKASTKSYSSTEAKLLGYSLLPNFAKENLNVIRSLNNVLNEELYDTTGEERKMVGYDHVYGSRDDKGTLSGYENHANTMYFMYDSEGENKIRSGLGMSITQFSSDYEDDSSREEILAQLMMPVSYVQEKGLSYASVLRAGYSDGEYERQGTSSRYEADIKSWVYGMSNSVRYKIKSRLFDIIPTAEFNVMGYYQEEIEENSEKPNSMKIKGENNISVEAGIGMILKKEIEINEISKLKLRAKAMYYHEYGEPYHDLEASVSQMPGSYKIRDIEGIYEKDRGILSGEIEYIYKPFSFYGNFKQFIEEENPIEINAGVKYNF